MTIKTPGTKMTPSVALVLAFKPRYTFRSPLSWTGSGERSRITEAGREASATMEEGIGQGVVTMEGAAQRVMTAEVDLTCMTEGDPDRVPGIGSGVERGRVRGRVRGKRWGGRKAGRA